MSQQREADFDRRLDLAAEYFEYDPKACAKELHSLLAEPDLPLGLQFTAHCQLAYNTESLRVSESHIKEVEKCFSALEKEIEAKPNYSPAWALQLYRETLDELIEWQKEDQAEYDSTHRGKPPQRAKGLPRR